MRFASRSRAVLGALLLAARLESSGTTMVFEAPPCGDKTESLCRALRNPDPAFRIAETRAVLAEALKSEGLGVLVVYEDDAGRAVVKAVDPMRTMAAGDPALNEVAQEVHERLARVLERLE